MTEYEKPRILSVTAQHVAELEQENAKLRELVEDMWRDRAALEWHPEYADRMRELGVEA